MSNFTFSRSDFYNFGVLSAIFIELKLSSAVSFSLEESKICRFGKGLKFPFLELINTRYYSTRVHPLPDNKF